jgi:hypothetical protein
VRYIKNLVPILNTLNLIGKGKQELLAGQHAQLFLVLDSKTNAWIMQNFLISFKKGHNSVKTYVIIMGLGQWPPFSPNMGNAFKL